MNCENKNQHDPSNYNKLILEIIYKDANESLKNFRDDINSINTRLAIIIGFDASFVNFLSKIPINSFLHLSRSSMNEKNLLPYANQIINSSIEVLNYLLTVKPVIGLSLIISVVAAIRGLRPTPNKIVLFPEKMLEKSKNTTEELFLQGIIENRNQTIEKLEHLIGKKAKMLNLALASLGITAVITIILIICDTSVTKWY